MGTNENPLQTLPLKYIVSVHYNSVKIDPSAFRYNV